MFRQESVLWLCLEKQKICQIEMIDVMGVIEC